MLLSLTLPQGPEATVAMLGVLALLAAAIYGFWKWLMTAPLTPDPWGREIEQEVEAESAVPVCPHCLTPQEHNGWFCPECGSMCGQYGNYLPSVWMFSAGEGMRSGVRQPGSWGFLITAGYILVALAYFSILAPVYCGLLVINRARAKEEERAEHAPGTA